MCDSFPLEYGLRYLDERPELAELLMDHCQGPSTKEEFEERVKERGLWAELTEWRRIMGTEIEIYVLEKQLEL